ncbi:MAG: hypothetical protein LBQ69_05785 [Treponema sp.]|jgi:hypothetical protein|nr:hypothetical protein [Treponema sp.]
MKLKFKILILLFFILFSVFGGFFMLKMIRGQKLINEINNYYIINNKYPNDSRARLDDQNDILDIYKKAFPNEDIYLGNFPQPYYHRWKNKSYSLYYMWSNKFTWRWLFEYDNGIKRWKISYMQY